MSTATAGRSCAGDSAVILTSIRHGREVVMPNGDTELLTDDEVTMLTDQRHVEELQKLPAGTAGHSTVGGA